MAVVASFDWTEEQPLFLKLSRAEATTLLIIIDNKMSKEHRQPDHDRTCGTCRTLATIRKELEREMEG